MSKDVSTIVGRKRAAPAAQGDLRVVEVLAALLSHLDQGTRVDPDQYRLVVARLTGALEATPMSARLRGILTAYPAARDLYENTQYANAGLCLHAIDQSLATEQAAREALAKARGLPV